MAIERSPEGTAPGALTPGKYQAALSIARQLNAEFTGRGAIRPFSVLLTRQNALPAVAVVGAVSALAAGIVAALTLPRRMASRKAQKALEAQPQPSSEDTAIQDKPTAASLTIYSLTVVIQRFQDRPDR